MSGGGVAYHLRPNKFVERYLFVELLQVIKGERSPDEFIYISLGGPQLEDQRLIHRRLGITKLFSIEESPPVYDRQLFNQRPSYIQCRNESTADFIGNFDQFTSEHPEESYVVWFDYSSPRERRDQLVEFQTLLGKLGEGDILKITMNASAHTLGTRGDLESWAEVNERRQTKIQAQLETFLPQSLPAEISNRNLPTILLQAAKAASLSALDGRPKLLPILLAAFVYKDAFHQMLTITVRIARGLDAEQVRLDLASKSWDYMPQRWTDWTRIAVPDLTAKERLHIEQLLFSDDMKSIHDKLPFWLAEDEEESLSLLKDYAIHCTRYPSYLRVAL